jgi:hypothetical protein
VVNITDDSGGGRTSVTDSFSDRVQNIPSSPQQSSLKLGDVLIIALSDMNISVGN